MNELTTLRAGGIILVIVVITLAVGSQIVGEVREEQTDVITLHVVNESSSPTYNTGENLNQVAGRQPPALSLNVYDVWNSTGNFHVLSTSYVANGTTQWTMNNQTLENWTFQVTYSFTADELTTAGNVSTSGLDALVEFGDWFVVIVTVLIASVIITILLTGFRRRSSA